MVTFVTLILIILMAEYGLTAIEQCKKYNALI